MNHTLRNEAARLVARRHSLYFHLEEFPMAMSKSKAKELLEANGFSGIDWSNVNWQRWGEIIQAIIAMFISQPRGASAGAEDKSAQAKAHFEAIKALAACGSDCCDCEE